MKKLLFFLFVFFLFNALKAQLRNTRWRTTLIINNPVNAIFDFRKDTVLLYTVADSSMIETSSYIAKGKSLTFKKVSGQSDCDNATAGLYNFTVKGDTLQLDLVRDECDDRSSVIKSTRWVRWKEHTEVKVKESVLKEYVGEYQLDKNHLITVTLENGRLYAEGSNNNLPKSPLYADSNTAFFLKVAGIEWNFVKDAKGNVVKLISHEEKDYELRKVK